VTCVLASVFHRRCSYDASQLRHSLAQRCHWKRRLNCNGAWRAVTRRLPQRRWTRRCRNCRCGSADGGASDMVTPFPTRPNPPNRTPRKRDKDESLLLVVRMRGIRTALVIATMGAGPCEQCDDRNNQSGDGCCRPADRARLECTVAQRLHENCMRQRHSRSGEVCDCGTDPRSCRRMHGAERPVQRRRHRLLEDLH